jgi:hypothetical protein
VGTPMERKRPVGRDVANRPRSLAFLGAGEGI